MTLFLQEEKELLGLCSRSFLYEAELPHFLQLVSAWHVNINCALSENCSTPILLLCRYYRGDNLYVFLKALLERPEMDLKSNRNGHNALALLCRHYQSSRLVDCARLLIKHDVRLQSGYTLMMVCEFQVGQQLLEVARLLINHMSISSLKSVSQAAVNLLIERGLRDESMALSTLIQSERQALEINRVNLHK